MNNSRGFALFAKVTVCVSILMAVAQSASPQAGPPAPVTSFWSMQHGDWPAFPAPPVEGLQVYQLTNGWLMDDRQVNYEQLQQQSEILSVFEGAYSTAAESSSGNNAAALMFSGDCTGHLLPPVYQVTNLVLSLAGAQTNDTYDLFTVANLSLGTWTYLGRWTNAQAPFIITDPPASESYYTVGCVNDTDGDGLPDVFETLVSRTDPNDPDTDYDGRSDSEELAENTSPLDAASFTPVRLAFFRFNDTNWLGDRAQAPILATNLQSVDAWITKAAQVTNAAAMLKYRTVEPDGKANINLRSGSVRLWFKPLWNSGVGPGAAAKIIEVGSKGGAQTNGWWSLFVNPAGDSFYFASQTNNMAEATNLTAPISFVYNNWYQLVLTYTNGAFALYTNGVLCATNTGTLLLPGLAQRQTGFTLGSDTVADGQAKGVFEDLETFNYALNPNDIVENFQLTEPPMLIPNLLMWLKADDGPVVNAAGRVDPWRDQSGNGNNASQAVDLNRPLYVANGIGGKPVVYFPGTNNYLTLQSTIFTNVTQLEGFAALQVDSAMPTNNRALWLVGPNGSRYPDSTGKIWDGFASSSPHNLMQVPAISLAQPHLYNVASRSNEWTCRLNGVVHFSQSNNVVQFKAPPIFLGNGGGNYFAGYMGEILFFSRVLSTTERFAVESYLSQRFNLLTNAPPVPQALTAFAVATNQISLTWSNELSNTNVGFIVQRSDLDRRCGYTNIALVRNGLSYFDTDLAAGTEYHYRIKAITYSGQAAFSTETSATTLTNGPTIPLGSLALWLKADSGHGLGPVNCWMDQSTNNNSAYFNDGRSQGAPRWAGFNTNGHPVIAFFTTNAFELPAFLTNVTGAEAFVVLRSFGSTFSNYVSLWWMSPDSLPSYFPYTNNLVWDNFGRSSTSVQFPTGITNFSTMRLYNPRSTPGEWSAAFNNITTYFTNVNTPAFPVSYSLLGRGDSTISKFLTGEITELMIFNRTLSQSERDAVSNNYLNNRYKLW